MGEEEEVVEEEVVEEEKEEEDCILSPFQLADELEKMSFCGDA